MKVFICIVEDYNGNKKNCRVFADNVEEARKQLIKEYPKCYVSPAIPLKEFKQNDKKRSNL